MQTQCALFCLCLLSTATHYLFYYSVIHSVHRSDNLLHFRSRFLHKTLRMRGRIALI